MLIIPAFLVKNLNNFSSSYIAILSSLILSLSILINCILYSGFGKQWVDKNLVEHLELDDQLSTTLQQ